MASRMGPDQITFDRQRDSRLVARVATCATSRRMHRCVIRDGFSDVEGAHPQRLHDEALYSPPVPAALDAACGDPLLALVADAPGVQHDGALVVWSTLAHNFFSQHRLCSTMFDFVLLCSTMVYSVLLASLVVHVGPLLFGHSDVLGNSVSDRVSTCSSRVGQPPCCSCDGPYYYRRASGASLLLLELVKNGKTLLFTDFSGVGASCANSTDACHSFCVSCKSICARNGCVRVRVYNQLRPCVRLVRLTRVCFLGLHSLSLTHTHTHTHTHTPTTHA
jgi:hypothetical protein